MELLISQNIHFFLSCISQREGRKIYEWYGEDYGKTIAKTESIPSYHRMIGWQPGKQYDK